MSQALTDPSRFPLHGSRLIEASAGTGKTYTIAALYVRLVLAHGDAETRFLAPLLTKQILVMTFTKAATEELSDRIRQRLADAARHFRDPQIHADDPFLNQLRQQSLEQHQSLAVLARRLELAAQSMDEAAIKTIHGWCQSMLNEHAFASGSLFSQHVETDDETLRQQAAEDYFRRFIYSADATLAGLLLDTFASPANMLSLTYGDLSSSTDEDDDAPKQLVSAQQQARQQAAEIKAQLAPIFREVITLAEQTSGTAQKVKQLQKFADWCASEELMPNVTPANWNTISLESFTDWATKKLGGMQPQWQPLTTLQQQLQQIQQQQQQALLAVKRHAAQWVLQRFSQLQQQRAQMSHNDMLTRLRDALRGSQGERLARTIRRQFPVALVDEFQDTDPIQYEILDRIYRVADPHPNTGIFLIGDPKQAIYSFRDADIFTYLKAREATQGRHYNLLVNYRSSEDMVAAVNHLFGTAEDYPKGAFLFKRADDNRLPFQAVSAKGRDTHLRHTLAGTNQASAALNWAVVDEPFTNKTEMFEQLASHHANIIAKLLNDPQAGFYDANQERKRNVNSEDIAILVNNFTEADAIQLALRQRGVRSVYLSDRNSVFAQRIAKEVLLLLSACEDPRNPGKISSAVACRLLDLSTSKLAQIHSQESVWEDYVEAFIGYQERWNKQGLLAMFQQLLHDFSIPTMLLRQSESGERQLADLLHIAELLQQHSQVVESPIEVVNYLAEHINAHQGIDGSARTQADEQQMRLESDQALVKIITIHKSKGLQYPIVFLPFACYGKTERFRLNFPASYHDDNDQLQWVWSKDDENTARVLAEQNAEELRKIYVAVTRAQHATFVNLASTKQQGDNPLFYLLHGDDKAQLPLTQLATERWQQLPHTEVLPLINEPAVSAKIAVETSRASLSARHMPHSQHLRPWWIASYSALAQHSAAELAAEPQSAEEMNLLEADETLTAETPQRSAPVVAHQLHDFPRGAEPGTLLHNLLEEAANQGFANVAAHSATCQQLVAEQCQRGDWQPYADPLSEWLQQYLQQPLPLAANAAEISLAELVHYQAEPEFWFPAHQLQTAELDHWVRHYIQPGVARPQLRDIHVNGMLKGFIDLVFEHNGRYFVVDYKSNWLGENDASYHSQALTEAMLHSRYDLQYVIYTLALHKLLQSRLGAEYDYDTHIGGIAYLFLRGQHSDSAGCYRDRPPRELIERLAELFAEDRRTTGGEHAG
ncbi:exodeoxyribonuclease V subunit beta [Idiomarina tyrosinivorans]|uniref:RecBCD enzyme subunit RecB n=1 Tax=Idiomarina tyrosinivorans TaxID=1445662 RepID=A0A432ZT34_9GAMM|nr:exodeoxyribonuclease V subunit beta [Idiomarina tyrosinivorans]RUO81094.1 exodeoxyribonuclease V subunit beta [Idiomarina tyrosinivorans]